MAELQKKEKECKKALKIINDLILLIPLRPAQEVLGGFAYGVAIIDLYSRKVLSMDISNSMDKEMCLEAAKEAIKRYGVYE